MSAATLPRRISSQRWVECDADSVDILREKLPRFCSASNMEHNPAVWFRARRRSDLGEAVQTIRQASSQNQSELADLTRTSRSTISRLERGGGVALSVAMNAIADLGYEIVIVPKGAKVTVESPDA